MTEIQLLQEFSKAAITTLKTMASIDAIQGNDFIKNDTKAWGEVTGIIGMADSNMSCNLVVSFDKECILNIVSKMFMEEFKEINPEVLDAVGEITNIICGNSKSLLEKHNIHFDMASPFVIRGTNVELKQLSKIPITAIPFSTEKGNFQIELAIQNKSE
jgi:chemotaxis protein CheX